MSKPEIDNFDQSVSFPMDKEYFEKSSEYIRAEQRARDANCLQLIERAATVGLLMHHDRVVEENSAEAAHPDVQRFFIDDEAKKLLEFYYTDGMAVYTEMFLAFDRIFGEEENIQVVDSKSGRLIRDNASLKDITPNSCVKVYYRDDNNNKVILTYPGLKNVTRAIQKLALNGKYHTEYKRRVRELRARCGDDRRPLNKACPKFSNPPKKWAIFCAFP